jgi:transcriptional regulator with XRE-family HTH domain
MDEQIRIKKATAVIWKQLRLESRLKRQYIADQLGMSKSTIDKIEQGAHHVRFADVLRYCQLVGCAPARFIELVMEATPCGKLKSG